MKTVHIAVGLVALAGIGFFVLNAEPQNQRVTTIGVIAPLSGAFAQYGEEVRKGITAASPKTTHQFEDEKCDAKTAVSAFQKLTSIDKIAFIIGPGCGSSQEAVAPLLKGGNVLALVSAAASKDLYVQSGGYLYNMQYSLEDESAFMAKEIYAQGYKKVALVTYANSFSDTHAKSFRTHYKGTIVIDTRIVDSTADLLTELTKINASGAEAIYAPDVSFFFGNAEAKLAQLDMRIPLFSTYVAELPGARTLTEGVTYSFPDGMTGSNGGVYELSKITAETLVPLVTECGAVVACVKQKLDASGKFVNGVYQRKMVLKRIDGGIPVEIN